MPIYEYRCTDCGKTFESLQKFNDEPFTNCGQGNVECATKGSGTVERLMSAPSFQFKGTGFYITDYKKESVSKPAGVGSSGSTAEGKSESKADSKVESKSESKSETKSESKPAAKTESKPAATKSSESSSSSKKEG